MELGAARFAVILRWLGRWFRSPWRSCWRESRLASADVTHEIHGLVRRRPAEEKMQAAVLRTLDECLGLPGPDWRASAGQRREPLNEVSACSLALGRAW